MKHHYFQPDPDADPENDPAGVDICNLCGEEADAAVHEMDGVPPDEPEFPDVPDDWPPNVVSYLEAVGIRQPA